MKLVVSGTGTAIGKTWVARALAHHFIDSGARCVALKPIESGGDADSCALERATGRCATPGPYRFEEEIGPHLAARRSGVRIDAQRCLAWLEREAEGSDVAIIELAGGLLSPLNDLETNADLLAKIGPDAWLAVAPDRLGALHDTKALMLAVEHLRLARPVVVLNAPEIADRSTGTNAHELSRLGTCVVAACYPRGEPTSAPCRSVSKALAAAIDVLLAPRPLPAQVR